MTSSRSTRARGERSPGTIITFYSYKGGTGRTMALANVAWVLASNGQRVLAVDWDLEAPGLHRYFQPFLVDKDLTASDGVIEMVLAFASEAVTKTEGGAEPDWYHPYANIMRYAASLDWKFPGGGTLDFVSAGRQTPSYSVKVNTFDWQNFYERLGGGVFLEAVREVMRGQYDYVLIDSRTGVSDTSGICTVQMPDALVVCFTLNNQSIDGAARVIDSVSEQRRTRPLPVFPVPMRVDNSEKDKVEVRREVMQSKLGLFPQHLEERQRRGYWVEVEYLYIPWYAYEEVLATFGDKPGTARTSLLTSTERLCHHLTHGRVSAAATVEETVRQDVLAKYARKPESATDLELNARAESFFGSLTAGEQAAARRMFTRLVRVPGAAEGGTIKSEQVPLQEIMADASPILPKATSAGLVVIRTEGDQTKVALADDALITRWRQLSEWLDADRPFLLWRQKLRADLAEWEKDKDSGALLSGAPLKSALRWRTSRSDDLKPEEKQYIEKSRVFRRLVAIARTAIAAAVAMVLIYQFKTSSGEERAYAAAALVERGDSLALQQSAIPAIARYDSAIDLNPAFSYAYIRRALAHASIGDTAEAMQDLDRATALSLGSGNGAAHLTRGYYLLTQGDTTRALEDLDQSLAEDSTNPATSFLRGNVNQTRGNPRLALADYSRAVGLARSNATYRLARGSAYEDLGFRDSAADDYTAVLAIFPDEKDSVLAVARLRQLGITSQPDSARNRVYVHYFDNRDAAAVERIVQSLKRVGWQVEGKELRPERTRGDVRFFYEADRRRAGRLQSDVELAAAEQGIQIDLAPVYRRGLRAPRGQLEIWLPALMIGKQAQVGK